MNISITIGQYYKENSIIHSLDPRAKILATFLYIVSIFLIREPIVFLVPLVFLIVTYSLAKVPFRYVFRGLKPVMILIIIAFLMNLFGTKGEAWIHVYKFTITHEGFRLAIKVSLRFIFLVTASSLMTYTTTSNNLAKGLESLMKPLKLVKFPVHDIATMISIALRFIPILVNELDKIRLAQRARGVDFDEGNTFVRIKKMIPLIIPLFASAMKKANEIAQAMDSRCYNSSDMRTEINEMKFAAKDYIALFVTLLYLGLIIVLRII